MMKAEKQTVPPANGSDASATAFKARFLSPVESKKNHSACAAVKTTQGPVLDPRRNIVSDLQAELYVTRRALRVLMFDLEHEIESHAVDTARALLTVKKYEIANSALVATKDALDHLNQDMTALNNQLRKALERHRSTAGYLQNVLESTDSAMLFVDADLKICFFTPRCAISLSHRPRRYRLAVGRSGQTSRGWQSGCRCAKRSRHSKCD